MIKWTHAGIELPIAQITLSQIINVIAAAKGADNVCADLFGILLQINIPMWTAAKSPAIGIKEGMKKAAMTWTQPALEIVELKPYWISLGLNIGKENMKLAVIQQITKTNR